MASWDEKVNRGRSESRVNDSEEKTANSPSLASRMLPRRVLAPLSGPHIVLQPLHQISDVFESLEKLETRPETSTRRNMPNPNAGTLWSIYFTDKRTRRPSSSTLPFVFANCQRSCRRLGDLQCPQSKALAAKRISNY
jgi:hypothetical protein